ncbi:MAG: hypothetical protein ACPGRD_03270 [Planktomarina sp.]
MSEPQKNHPARSDRRRRLTDAALILPATGAVLVMVPLIWPKLADGFDGVRTSTALIYLFGIWTVMIVLAALLARLIKRSGLSDD